MVFLLALLVSCEAVTDLLGFGDEEEPASVPDASTDDWSQSMYAEIGQVTGTEQIAVPSRLSGRQLYYVVTNGGAIDRWITFPYASSQPSVSSSTVNSLGAYQQGASRWRIPIRGFPGQFDLPAPLVRRESSSEDLRATSTTSVASTPVVGDTESFTTASGTLTANLHQVRVQGEWSLYVWVHEHDTLVTEEISGVLADRFMDPDNPGDIFDLVNGVFGLPWGTHHFGNVIEATRKDIHILLYDIDGDGVPEGGSRVVGYFWPKDNYLTEALADELPASNERLMFYLDSALLTDTRNRDWTDDGVWASSDFWPEEVISTLAHEYQHMIQFYQRRGRRGQGSEYETWLNELASMAAEEVVSRSIGVYGPRGVDPTRGDAGSSQTYDGRMPWYNYTGPEADLLFWPDEDDTDVNDLDHYAASYSFGSFLLRAYGPDFLTALLQEVDPAVDTDYSKAAVVAAVNRATGATLSFGELMRRWGVATFVSDDRNVPPGYRINTGTWIGDGTTTGTVGSINAHNYRIVVDVAGTPTPYDGPRLFRTDAGNVAVVSYTNTFLSGGVVPSNGATLSFNLPQDVSVTVLAR
jgi:hypothetical protein